MAIKLPSYRAAARRLRFRFGMRTLLLVLTLAAVWLGLTMQAVRTQRAAVAQLQAANGSLLYDYQSNGVASWSRTAQPLGPQWLRRLIGPEYFDKPVLASVTPHVRSDDWVQAVNNLPTLKRLHLSGGNVTDESIQRMTPSSALSELHVRYAQLSAEGVASLEKFPNLRRLDLSGPAVTDEVVARLVALPSLVDLGLENTAASDASVSVLVKLPRLRRVMVFGNRLTETGVEKLQHERPDVVVLFSPERGPLAEILQSIAPQTEERD
jgi:hypothetical protein